MTGRVFSRRRLLRGAGGAALALPWLEAFSERRALAAVPSRFIVVFRPNGVFPDNFWPTVRSETDFTLNTACKPLEPWKSRLAFLDGVDMPMAAKSPGDAHQQGMGACLTGRKNQAGTIQGVNAAAGYADGISLDQEMANQIGGGSAVRSLNAGVLSDFVGTANKKRMIFSAPGQPVPSQDDPLKVYQAVFKAGRSATATDVATDLKKSKSVLDAVLAQFDDVSRRVGSEDRARLGMHAELIRSIERRLATAAAAPSTCTTPPAPAPSKYTSQTEAQNLSRLQIDLMAAALACGLTRVASLQYVNSDNQWSFAVLPDPANDHSMGHTEWGSTEIGLTRDQGIQRRLPRHLWYATEFAYLLDKLAAYHEGERTLLDNCGVLWMSDLATGGHSFARMPYVLAGAAGGRLRTGRALRFNKASNCDLFVSLLNLFDVKATTFGDPAYCKGPLPGLF
jgi:hypothetical protein